MKLSPVCAAAIAAVGALAASPCAAQAAADLAPEAALAAAEPAVAAPALWTAGLFMVAGSHPAYPGSDHRIQSARALPFITYRGPLLRVEGGTAGLRGFRTPRYEFAVSASGSFGSGGSDVKARAGMPSIGTLAEAGPSLRINLGDLDSGAKDTPWRLTLPVRGVFDVSRDFAYRGIAFEPRLSFSRPLTGDWNLVTDAALLVGDRKVNDMFYGVAPVYATAARPAYEAKAGLISSRIGVALSRPLGKDFRLGLFARIETVSGAANADSPLVRRDVDGRIGITLSWTAFRSDSTGVD